MRTLLFVPRSRSFPASLDSIAALAQAGGTWS